MSGPIFQRFGYSIRDIHATERYPGVLYAHVYDANDQLILSATYDMCVERLRELCRKESLTNFGF